MRNRGRITLLVAAAALALAGCGSSTAAGGPSATTLGTVPVGSGGAAGPTAKTATECTAADIKVAGKYGDKPTVTVPDTCAPPTKLVVKDLSTGSGKEATAGATVLTNYLLVTWSDKQVLDTSFGRGPFPLENLGQAQVIEGWNEGMIGIRQGGRRLLIVPPDKGYGEGGNGIKPNETLVFVVDAVKVT